MSCQTFDLSPSPLDHQQSSLAVWPPKVGWQGNGRWIAHVESSLAILPQERFMIGKWLLEILSAQSISSRLMLKETRGNIVVMFKQLHHLTPVGRSRWQDPRRVIHLRNQQLSPACQDGLLHIQIVQRCLHGLNYSTCSGCFHFMPCINMRPCHSIPFVAIPPCHTYFVHPTDNSVFWRYCKSANDVWHIHVKNNLSNMQYLSTSPHLKPKIPHHFSMSSAENRFLSQCMAGPQKPMNAFRLGHGRSILNLKSTIWCALRMEQFQQGVWPKEELRALSC